MIFSPKIIQITEEIIISIYCSFCDLRMLLVKGILNNPEAINIPRIDPTPKTRI